MSFPGGYANLSLIIGPAAAGGGIEGEQMITIIFVLFFACLQLRLQLRCVCTERVKNPHNLLLHLYRRYRNTNLSKVIRTNVDYLCSICIFLLLSKEILRLEEIGNIFRILIMSENYGVSTCDNIITSEPCYCLAYIFDILTCAGNNKITGMDC